MDGSGDASSEEGVRILLQKKALVFLNVVFLDGVENILLTFLSKIDLEPFL